MTRSSVDQTQVLTLIDGLLRSGCVLGARQVASNALAQAEAAEMRDLLQRPAFGRRVKPAPHPHAANDHQPTTSQSPVVPFA